MLDAQRVQQLTLRAFRNITDQKIEPGEHFNVIHGDNGAGKSNVLEAIYYLGALKSFRSAKKDDLIQVGADSAQISCLMQDAPLPKSLKVRLSRQAPAQDRHRR